MKDEKVIIDRDRLEQLEKFERNNEKIMIFGDYDVDGVTSSFILYKCITKYLKYKKI
jgi:single-stranded DNA-specific DHH superfamily exonuclease